MTPLVRETIRRANESAEVNARRLGLTRRQFLSTAAGSALTLFTLAACSREEQASRDAGEPGGTFTIPPVATTEPEAATTTLAPAPEEVIVDVQAHLLDYEVTPDVPWDGSPYIGQIFPQAACGESDPRSCFSIEAFLDLFFLQSDTAVAVLSAIPVFGTENPLSAEVMARTQAIAGVLCEQPRVLAHGQAAPNLGELSASLAAMTDLRDRFSIDAWKVYPHTPAAAAFRLDDGDPNLEPIGQRFLDHVREVGPPIVCVHKGFRGVAGGGVQADPVDVGPAAVNNPDIDIVVYHSGFESDVAEGPYDPAAPNAGIDRLIASVESAGLAPGSNVYAELGSTWRAVMGDPDTAAHVIGKLLVAVGEDRIVWGTDSIWYGTPQDQIEAFRMFEISAEYQERFGYPALTTEIKNKIFGGNAAELYGIDLAPVPCAFSREDLVAARAAAGVAPASFG